MTFTHTHSWTLQAPPARVFHALTSPAELSAWFAEHADVEAGPGGRYRFWGRHTLGTPAAHEATQAITAFAPGETLHFTWRVHGVDTEVRLALAPAGDATTLSLQHEVRGDLGVPRPRQLVDDHWRLAFGNLASHLAGGTGIYRPDFADPAPEVRYTIGIAAPPAEVFRALIDPDAVTRWLDGKDVIVEPRVGGRYLVNWSYQVDGTTVAGGPTTILEYEQDRKLVLDWPDWRGDASVTGQRISFLLAPSATGTTLTFTHGGFHRTADLSDYPFGWEWLLGKLKAEVTQL